MLRHLHSQHYLELPLINSHLGFQVIAHHYQRGTFQIFGIHYQIIQGFYSSTTNSLILYQHTFKYCVKRKKHNFFFYDFFLHVKNDLKKSKKIHKYL